METEVFCQQEHLQAELYWIWLQTKNVRASNSVLSKHNDAREGSAGSDRHTLEPFGQLHGFDDLFADVRRAEPL